MEGQDAKGYYLYPESYDYGHEIKVRIILESNKPVQIKIFNTKREYDIFMNGNPMDGKRNWASVKELDVVEYVSEGNMLLIYNGYLAEDLIVNGSVEYLE